MQEDNGSNFQGDLARMLGGALGAAQSVKQDIHIQLQDYIEKMLHKMQFVKQEDFDVVKDMISKARQEQEALEARVSALEAKVKDDNE